jgi:hypothetical protein
MLLTLAVVATAASACGGDDDATPTSTLIPTCSAGPTEPVTLEGKQDIFDLGDLAAPISATTENGYVVIEARSNGSIEDLAIAFQDVVTGAGFDISGTDAEGDEAEVFFAKGDTAAGQVKMNESDCDGYVDIKISVLDDPAVLPSS